MDESNLSSIYAEIEDIKQYAILIHIRAKAVCPRDYYRDPLLKLLSRHSGVIHSSSNIEESLYNWKL